MKRWIFGLCLPFALALTMCGAMPIAESTPEPQVPIQVTFDTVCQQKEGTLVSIDGYPRLFGSTRQFRRGLTTLYEIFLQPGDSTRRDVTLHVVGADPIGKPGANQMAALPSSYTFSDLHLVLNNGTEAPADAKLHMTGLVKPYYDACLITVEKIEMAQKAG
jgi:hypothetical protein